MSITDEPVIIDTAEVVAGFGDLPTLAPVAVEVLRLADDDRASLEDIADVISRDPGLAAQLLKVANSPMYGMGGDVASLGRAASILGLRTVKLLSLSFAVVAETSGDGDDAMIWRRTLASSALAQSIANRHERRLQDEAFIAALLANLGRMALLKNATYAEACEAAGGWLTTADEWARFHTTGDEVAAEILLGWGLPPLLASAVRHRSDPGAIDGVSARLASFLAAADAAAGFIVADDDAPMALEQWHSVAARELQLDEAGADELLEESQAALDSVAEMFDSSSPGDQPVNDLLQRAREGLARLSLDVVAALSQEQTRAANLENENERLAAEAMTDSLTGLPNRRAFEEALTNAISGHERGSLKGQLGMMVLDLDKFKAVNDTYGHQVGDDVLRAAAGRLKGQCREGEMIARVGGEEFAVLLPSTDAEGIQVAGDRLRSALADSPVDTAAGPLEVTTSIGVAIAPFIDPDTMTALFQRADEALYAAKESGRNCVRLAA